MSKTIDGGQIAPFLAFSWQIGGNKAMGRHLIASTSKHFCCSFLLFLIDFIHCSMCFLLGEEKLDQCVQ